MPSEKEENEEKAKGEKFGERRRENEGVEEKIRGKKGIERKRGRRRKKED